MGKLYYCVGCKRDFQEYHFGGKMHIPNEEQLKHCAPFSLQDKGNDFAICSAKYMAIQKAIKQVCVHLPLPSRDFSLYTLFSFIFLNPINYTN